MRSVLLLSKLIDRSVRSQDGQDLGRIADVTAQLATHSDRPAVVDRILLSRRHQGKRLVPWDALRWYAQNDPVLTSDATSYETDSIDEALRVDEILLRRDVLDTQIVDITGQRLARVADVVLARDEGRVEVVGVETGFGAVLRRLNLGWLARRMPVDLVAWSDLHLTSERGHSVALTTPRSAVHLLDARGLAMLIAKLDTQSAAEVLATRDADVIADVVRVSHPSVGERVLRTMSDSDAAEVMAAMPAHHAKHWRSVLRSVNPRRHFLRSRVWPRRREHPEEAQE